MTPKSCSESLLLQALLSHLRGKPSSCFVPKLQWPHTKQQSHCYCTPGKSFPFPEAAQASRGTAVPGLPSADTGLSRVLLRALFHQSRDGKAEAGC